jgi:predicted DNA-binding transcriptional regulator AlpA
MEGFLNEFEVSEKLKISVASLRRRRVLRQGPPFVKVGSLVRYRPEALDQWVEELPMGGTGEKRMAVPRPRPRLVRGGGFI